MRRVLIISTSIRTGSNSELLARAFAQGAREAGHDVTFETLHGKDLQFCRGCYACQKTLRCVMHDDASALAEKVKDAEVVAFATPVYFFGMSGQMKVLIDRLNPLFPSDYQFRDIYLLMAAAEPDTSLMDPTVEGLNGWIRCFPKCRLAGCVRGGGIEERLSVNSHPELLEEARQMGASIEERWGKEL